MNVIIQSTLRFFFFEVCLIKLTNSGSCVNVLRKSKELNYNFKL